MPDQGKLIQMQFCNTCYFTKRLSHASNVPSSPSLKQGKRAQHRVPPGCLCPVCELPVHGAGGSCARGEEGGNAAECPTQLRPGGQWRGCGLYRRGAPRTSRSTHTGMEGRGIEGFSPVWARLGNSRDHVAPWLVPREPFPFQGWGAGAGPRPGRVAAAGGGRLQLGRNRCDLTPLPSSTCRGPPGKDLP